MSNGGRCYLNLFAIPIGLTAITALRLFRNKLKTIIFRGHICSLSPGTRENSHAMPFSSHNLRIRSIPFPRRSIYPYPVRNDAIIWLWSKLPKQHVLMLPAAPHAGSSLRFDKHLRGIIPRKVFCLIFDSLANPAALLKRDLRFASTSHWEYVRCCGSNNINSSFQYFTNKRIFTCEILWPEW